MGDHQTPSRTPTPAPKAAVPGRGRRLLRQALLFAIAVLVINTVVGEKGLVALRQARRDYRALELSLEQARAENAALRDQARRLREDPSAIEEEARRELGLIKAGEILFIIRDAEPKK